MTKVKETPSSDVASSIALTISSFKRMNMRQTLNQIFIIFSIISTALMVWKSLAYWTNCESPIVVVLSESMSPAFERGDILFLARGSTPISAGDICVFKLSDREIPIQALIVFAYDDSKFFVLTKGDNNRVHDRSLYSSGQEWLMEGDVIGRVYGYVPYVGMITIIMTDNPILKYALLAVLAGLVLISRE
ncbi:Signal peptidase complex catalytic subunit [Mitosporidium daphniae]